MPKYPYEDHIDLTRRCLVDSVPRLIYSHIIRDGRTHRTLIQQGLFVYQPPRRSVALDQESYTVYFYIPVYDKLLKALPHDCDIEQFLPVATQHPVDLKAGTRKTMDGEPLLIESKHHPWLGVMLGLPAACNLLQEANIERIEQLRPPVLESTALAQRVQQIARRCR